MVLACKSIFPRTSLDGRSGWQRIDEFSKVNLNIYSILA